MLDGQEPVLKTYMAEKRIATSEAISPVTFKRIPIQGPRENIIFQATNKAEARQWLIDNDKLDHRIVWESTPK